MVPEIIDKNDFVKNLIIPEGEVTYNEFHIDENIPFEEQRENYQQDILQIKFGDRFTLDVGWYPEMDPEGHFAVVAILDNDWINHLSEMKCTTLSELRDCINRTAFFINEMRKIKDIPPRNIEFEEWD